MRKKYIALDFKAFSISNVEEVKQDPVDEVMANEDFQDVSHMAKKSKRNKTATAFDNV